MEPALNSLVILTDAYHFAAAKHVDQRRKGEAAEPYMNHLAEVADLVARATAGTDLDVVVAAVLHDTVEDTETTFAELSARFGDRVASLVAEVTDDKALTYGERKQRQIDHTPSASPAAKIIKLADKTSNLRALVASPPKDWSMRRRSDYLEWSRRVVAGCRGANAWLEAEFDAAAHHLERETALVAA